MQGGLKNQTKSAVYTDICGCRRSFKADACYKLAIACKGVESVLSLPCHQSLQSPPHLSPTSAAGRDEKESKGACV